ncbi:MAG: 23S rRNA (pseudouridine(1915)-N(3))-methyltransferase RlmH [Candidatus Velthaea sp.]
MYLRLIAVGKLREPYLAAAAADFRKRIAPYHRLEEIEVRASDGDRPDAAMAAEGEAILRAIAPSDHVWLLERSGAELSSVELSQRLERLGVEGTSRVTFVIAGTYGASPALLERANLRWSLSRLTLLHEWARVLVLEQLYRAAKIAKDEPYHH